MEDGKKSAIRIWACAMAFLGILILYSRYVKAAPSDPLGYLDDDVLDSIAQVVSETYGYPLNDNEKALLWQYGFNPDDNYYLTIVKYPNNLNYYYGPDPVVSDTTVTYSSGYNMLTYPDGTFSYSQMSNYSITISNNVSIIGKYNDIVETEILYNFAIPNFIGGVQTQVQDYSPSPNVPIQLVSQKILASDPDPDDYVIEVKARFALPTNIRISKINNQTKWDYLAYAFTDWIDLWDYSDNKKLTQVGTNKYSISLPSTIPEWTNLFNQYKDTIDFDWEYNELSAVKVAMRTMFISNNLPMAGVEPNYFDIYVRYVGEVDGVLCSGRWTHLTNISMSVLDAPAENIYDIPLVPGQGSSIVTNEQANDNINNGTSDPYILPNINVNTNFNYPDQNTLNYPTITSFNHDNILVKFINTANQLPEFFEGFSSFLASAFVFIDPSIWAIMGFGMMCSIVIMIIKIL